MFGFGSSKKELQFTMNSREDRIEKDPKESDEFDIFTYKPTGDVKEIAGRPPWFSEGGFIKLEKGGIFKGTFKDKESNSEKHFIGKFIHATFYTANILGEDKAAKTYNDIAVTFEITNIGEKEPIEKEFGEKNFDSDKSTTKITPDNSREKIEKIKYCSVAADAKNKLVSIRDGENTIPVDSEVKPEDKSEDTNKNSSLKHISHKDEKYIISDLVVSSNKGGIFGTTIEADDVFLQSLVPTKPEQKPESDGQPAAAGQAGAQAPAVGTESPSSAPAPSPGPGTEAQPPARSQEGGRKRKSGKKKRKSNRRRKTKRNSRIRR